MPSSPVPRRNPAAIWEEVPETGESILLDRDQGNVLALNPTASAIWELVDGERSVAELGRVLSEATETEPQQTLRDVEKLVAALAAQGFVELDQGTEAS